MSNEDVKKRVAELRESAKRTRQAAERAETNADRHEDLERARRMDIQANQLEAELLQSEMNGGIDG